jgi:hypothetical protein
MNLRRLTASSSPYGFNGCKAMSVVPELPVKCPVPHGRIFCGKLIEIFMDGPEWLSKHLDTICTMNVDGRHHFIAFGVIGIFGTVERRRPGVQPCSTAFSSLFCAIAF